MTTSKSDSAIAAALLAGCTQKEAAARAGVSERTVRRRLADCDFAATLHAARSEAMRNASTQLLSLVSTASDRIRGLMDHDDPRVQLSAARLVLTSAARYVELADLDFRIRMLEQAASDCSESARAVV